MNTPSEHELIYDWNKHEQDYVLTTKRVELSDETLGDGLQNPSVTDPPIDRKIQLLRLMNELDIDAVNLGLPGYGKRARQDIAMLAEIIRDENLGMRPNCELRTALADVRALLGIVEDTGVPIDAAICIGSSPIRQYTEECTVDDIQKMSVDAVSFAVEQGLSVMYVLEDTTRSRPDDLRRLYTAAIEAGAGRICICDTCGHVMPYGVRNLVTFVRQIVSDSGLAVKIDWHGHSDRGLSVINALSAIKSGVDRVHATGLGIGERVGNTPMDLLLVNMKLDGLTDRDLTRLAEYARLVASSCRVPLPHVYPVFGRDAFRTATSVHAATVIKAKQKGDDWLADRVYSGVPAGWFGRRQHIEIGPHSGEPNIVYWLTEHGMTPDKRLVDPIFTAAKQRGKVLTDEEIWNVIKYTASEGDPLLADSFDEWALQIKFQGGG